MQRSGNTVVFASSSRITPQELKKLKGSPLRITELRIVCIVVFSLILHGAGAYWLAKQDVKKQNEVKRLEEIPNRMAKLIVDKPIPKDKTPAEKKTSTAESKPQEKSEPEKSQEPKKQISTKEAETRVQQRTRQVEKKVRTVGVLGMLTASGKTAKGPSVANILGEEEDASQDLDRALNNVTGLKQTRKEDIMQSKLVKSKDIDIDHRESIDDLVADIGPTKTAALGKKGGVEFSRPKSIEGAGKTSANRSIRAINKLVEKHKLSLQMSYEKYLKRVPDLSGKITVRFIIAASGTVTEVQVLENTTGNEALVREIVRKIKMWRFDSVEQGETTVTYPFVFKPQ